VQVQFKRVDQETLKAMVILAVLNLFLEFVFCTGEGWRVCEVGVVKPNNTSSPRPDYFRGFATIAEAESAFKARTAIPAPAAPSKPLYDPAAAEDGADDEDDDDGYWDQYDRTPARTPAVKRSPAPQSMTQQQQQSQPTPYRGASSAEDAYFAQYDTVQPALDNDDPSQAASPAAAGGRQPPPPLGLSRALPSSSRGGTDSTPPVYTPPEFGTLVNGHPRAAEDRSRSSSPSARQREEDEQRAADGLLAPRPASSASSNGSASVARLEEVAARRDQSEFGVRQHITRSVRSLFLLSRASGIDREEFEDMVRRELDVLGMVEDEM
jgi:hypothetical protein